MSDPSVLSVLTINIWNRQGPWPERRKLLIEGMKALDADVIGMQEVYHQPDTSQAQELADALGYHYAFGPALGEGGGYGYGNAVLSRHPIDSHYTAPLSGAEVDEGRSLLVANVTHPLGALPVLVTHLSWRFEHGFMREKQVLEMAAVLDTIEQRDGVLPAIVMGDLNAQPDSTEIRFLLGLHALEGRSTYLADCYGETGELPGYTFDERHNPYAAGWHERPRRIDYVLVRGPDLQGHGKPLSAKLALTEVNNGVAPSDHFGVYAEIRL